MSTTLNESEINIISEGSRLEGRVSFQHISRVHGILHGEVSADDGSILVLCETSVVEGSIQADTLMIDGYVKGDITAKTRVVVSRTGRVLGNIKTPNLSIQFGAYFEGRCTMDSEPHPRPPLATSTASLKPA